DLATVESLVRTMRALDADPDARLAEALACGFGGDEQRAVRMLAELLPSTVDAPVAVGLCSVVARVAFLQPIPTPAAGHTARALLPDMRSRAAPQRLVWMLTLGSVISPGFVALLTEDAAGREPHPFSAPAATALAGLHYRHPDLARARAAVPGPDDP